MVNEISPNYYAAGENAREYTLKGVGFNLIPGDAIGLLAYKNALPLENINSQTPTDIYDIVSKTPTEIVVREEGERSFDFRVYLGGIVSADRQTVYWTNDTHPLP